MNCQFVCVQEGCVLDRIITTMPNFLQHSRQGHTVIELDTFLSDHDAVCRNYNEKLDEICDELIHSVQALVRNSIQQLCCKIEDYCKQVSLYVQDIMYSKKQQWLSRAIQLSARNAISELQCYQALQFQHSNLQTIQEFSQKSYLQNLQLEDEFAELEQCISWQYLLTKTEVKLTQTEKPMWEQVIDCQTTNQIDSRQATKEPLDQRKPLRGYKANQSEQSQQQQQQQIDQIHQITNISEPLPLRGYKSNYQIKVDPNPFNIIDPDKQTRVDVLPNKSEKVKSKQVPPQIIQKFDIEESDKHVQLSKNHQSGFCKSLGFAVVTGTFTLKQNSHLAILISKLTVNETLFIGILDQTKFKRNEFQTTSEGVYGINQIGALYNNKQLTQSNIKFESKQKIALKYYGTTQNIKIKAKGYPPAKIVISDGNKQSVYQYFVSMSQAKVMIINYE